MDALGERSELGNEDIARLSNGGVAGGQCNLKANNTIQHPNECLQCRKPLPSVKRWGDCRRSGYCSKECSAFQPTLLAQSSRASKNSSHLPFSSLRITPRSSVPTSAIAENAAGLPAPQPAPHIPKATTARWPRSQPIKTLKNLCIASLAEHASLLTDISGIGETLGVQFLSEIIARQRLTVPLAKMFLRSFPGTELGAALQTLDFFSAVPPPLSGPGPSVNGLR